MINKIILWFIYSILFLFSLNCNIQHKFVFSPQSKNLNSTEKTKILALEILEDLRQKDNYQEWGYVLIPFYFWETLESPRWKFNSYATHQAEIALTYALKKEFLSYDSFKEVFVNTNSEYKEANYLLKGKILKTEIKDTMTLYGISIFGIYLIPFGLPIFYHQMETEIEIELVDVKTNKILLSRKYATKLTYFENLYSDSFVKKANSLLEKHLANIVRDSMDVILKQ